MADINKHATQKWVEEQDVAFNGINVDPTSTVEISGNGTKAEPLKIDVDLTNYVEKQEGYSLISDAEKEKIDNAVIGKTVNITPNSYDAVQANAVFEFATQKITNITQLRNTIGKEEGQVVTLLGYNNPNDKNPLNYKWTSVEQTDNGGDIITITGEGTWIAQGNEFSVKDFGGNLKKLLEIGVPIAVIDDTITLGNEIINASPSTKIIFKGGKVVGGKVTFQNNLIEFPNFENTEILGEISNTIIDDRGFIGNDTILYKFYLRSVFRNKTKFVQHRDYTIEYANNPQPFFSVENVQGGEIDSNGYFVYDNFYTENTAVRYFLQFTKSDNFKVKLKYKSNLMNPTITDDTGGVCVIKTLKDCTNLDIDIEGYNTKYNFFGGKFGLDNFVTDGVAKSKLKSKAYNVGYAIAIERGVDNDIDVEFDTTHRAVYLAGVEGGNVLVKGKGSVITNVNAYLTDTVYYDKGDTDFTTPLFACPKRLNIESIDTGSDSRNAQMCNISSYGTEFHFAQRTTPHNYEDIRIKIANIDGQEKQGVVISIKPHTDITQNDKINLTIDSSNFDNAGYYLLNCSNNVTLSKFITLRNVQSNGQVLLNPNDGDKYTFNNSSIGLLSIQKAGNASIELRNSTYANMLSAVESNNVTIISDKQVVKSSDTTKFKQINVYSDVSNVVNSLNFTGAAPSHKKNLLVIPSDGASSYPYVIDRYRLANGESYEFIVRSNRVSDTYISLNFAGNNLLNADNTIKLQVNDCYKITTFKSNDVIYTYVDRLDIFGFYVGNTVNRPTAVNKGVQYYDLNLNKLVIYNGTAWDIIPTQSSAVNNATTSTATTLEDVVSDLNNLVNVVNAKLAADRVSGQQAT